MKIKTKMLIYILSASILIYIIAIGYITFKSGRLALNQVTTVANTKAQESANIIKSRIDVYIYICKTLAETGKNINVIPFKQMDTLYLEAQKNVLEKYPEFIAVATSFELSAIDTSWDKSHGRRLTGWYRDEHGTIKFMKKRLNLQSDDKNSNYYEMKTTGKSMIVDPELYSYSGNEQDRYLNSNISIPIMLDGDFIGLAGIDIDLQGFQKIIEKIHPFEESFAYLLSHNGTFAAHSNDDYLGKPVDEIYPDLSKKNKIKQKVKAGKGFSFTDELSGSKKYYSFAPVEIDEVDTPWSVGIIVPYKVIREKSQEILITALFVGIIGLIILSLIIWYIAKNISEPIEGVTGILKKLSQGQIDQSLKAEKTSEDEIGEMTVALNKSIDDLNQKADFANKIGQGELESEFELGSEDDKLGKALINMRDSLKKAREEEKQRKEEDEKRRWINEGLAKFADILRQNNDNLEKLSYEIITNLIQYLGANQGGLFMLNDEDENDPFYELKAAYAYNRKKYLEKRIDLGEGLVGTCAIEKKTIYMTELPEDYIDIDSGLGDAPPDALLIVPLKMEEEVLGILEIATFSKFEKHHIEFVERVAESIASTLSAVRVNIRTNQLLEKSQQQAEEMSSQEEEMRQNMEELQATQEESARREKELKEITEAIDSLFLNAELNKDKTLIQVNDQFTEIFGSTKEQLKGESIESLIHKDFVEKFQEQWPNVVEFQTYKDIIKFKSKKGNIVWLLTTFHPVKDDEGNLKKILFFGVDNTKSRKEKEKMREKLKKLGENDNKKS
jgi:PAS domain S-box-containing protein